MFILTLKRLKFQILLKIVEAVATSFSLPPQRKRPLNNHHIMKVMDVHQNDLKVHSQVRGNFWQLKAL